MESILKNRRRIIREVSFALVIGALVTGIFGISLSLVQTSRTISSAGSVRGIGVGIYTNSACTNQASSINWGLLDPDSSKAFIIYVRNEGNSVTTLSKATQNWNPTVASNYMILNWDYTGQTLSVNQVLKIVLTLSISQDISGITSFSFDITITATG